jgi:drug/metabolite transporter (DMT)-like permease
VNPIVAVLLGALFAHETLSLRTLVAAGLIIGSVSVVIIEQQMRPRDSCIPAITETGDCAR